MRISGIIFSLAAVACVSACTDSPIRTSKWWPSGYHGQHRYAKDMTEQRVVTVQQTQITPATTATTTTMTQDTTRQMTTSPVLMHETYFNHGSARLSPVDKTALRAVAQDVKAKDADVTVVGHASSRVDGDVSAQRADDLNYNISNKRAIAVTNELTQQGVSPSKISAVAKGDQQPNAHTGDKTQEAADRRVEIFANDGMHDVSSAPVSVNTISSTSTEVLDSSVTVTMPEDAVMQDVVTTETQTTETVFKPETKKTVVRTYQYNQ